MNSSERLSAGLKALPDKISSFASTQAAWRFYQNESVSLSKLQEPLTVAAHQGILAHCMNFALCVHDWSRLSYKHANKPDTYAITHDTDIGYDLQTSLIISDQTGQPLAPVAQRLVSREGSFATYQEANPQPIVQNHLDEVSDCIQFLEQQGFAKPLVHLIDREGDSIAHIRRWEATGSHWLVRVKDNPKVDYQAKPMACKAVAQELEFIKTRSVSYHGKAYWQWVAETEVTLTRPAKPSQKKSKKPAVPGIPVAARLVVSRVLSDEGEVLAEWLLLTNVKDVDASTIALWYYWR
ncbi:MAG: hypothetical protein Q8K19_09285, partial [Methylicorpusculum sp.]|uniref:hypothetical protein n=1 Tax=Methylicorpusculum sp. TaxID=2713644 RepID=UPI0027319AC6